MRLLIIRHCETIKNIDNKFDSIGVEDNLTPNGKNQLISLCKFLNKYLTYVPNIYSSNRRRSELTAMGVAKYFNVNYMLIESLPPINAGKLSGLTEDEAWDRYPELMSTRVKFKNGEIDGYNISFPDGDSVRDYEKSLFKSMHRLLSNDQDFILITHRSVILACLNIFNKKLRNYQKNRYYYFDTPKSMIVELIIDVSAESGSIEIIGNYEMWVKECYDKDLSFKQYD
jgi:broad specificity phosphatase PhoE